MRPTLYAAEWVLPVATPPIQRGAVLVNERGVIDAVAPVGSLDIGDDVDIVDLGSAILLPGLVNVHAHAELAGMRGLIENIPFHEWIPALRRAKLGAVLQPADQAAAARWTCLEALAGGVTTLGTTEDSGAALGAMREAGLRGIVYREVFGPAPAQAHDSLQGLRASITAMRSVETDLVRIGVSPHAPYTVSDELFTLVADLALAEALPVAVHTAEAEVETQLITHGAGPFAAGLRTRGIATPPRARSTVQLLRATRVLAARPLLIHCVGVDDSDIDILADAGACVAHCPVANARLGHGIAPAIEMMEAGITVALGSDSVAANNRIDMLEEARIAQLMQRARLRSAGVLPPDRLLRMLTIDGARALGLDSRTGTLEPGKDADLCAVRIGAPHTVPVHDPVATLLLSTRGADVVLTAVRGAVLCRDGRFLTLNPETHRAQLEDAATRLRAARDAR